MNDVLISVPSRADFLHVLRGVVASVASRIGLSYEAIDDLAMAVNEAGAELLARHTAPSELKLKLSSRNDGVEVVMWLDSPTDAWPPEGGTDSWSWQVLSTLADEAEFVVESGGPGIRLAKRSDAPRQTAGAGNDV